MDHQEPPRLQFVQAVTIPAGARKPELGEIVPPSAVAVTIRITVSPVGAALMYTPGQPQPVRFNAPTSEAQVRLSGPNVYVQLVDGAREWKSEIISWADR